MTVSLTTAILPALARRANSEDLAGLGGLLSSTVRTALVVVVPFAALLPVVAPALAQVLFGYGAAAESVENYVPSLALFGAGLVVFTVHYLMLRGYYALELTRTVFYIQCAVAATNIVAALVLVASTSVKWTSPALIGAYTAAYLVGAVVSSVMLQRRIGGLGDGVWSAFLGKLVFAVVVSTGVALLLRAVLPALPSDPSVIEAFFHLVLLGGAAVPAYLLAARALRIDEVTSVLSTVLRRTRRS